MATAGELLGRLAGDLSDELGPSLLGLAVHGSWVAGDFVHGRSGLGLLAVLARDPDRHVLGRAAWVHQRLVRDYPQWAEHIEIDFVSPGAVADALAGGTDHVMLRICPGELLHLGRTSLQYLLNWRSAVEHNQVLVGRPPGELLPHIGDEVVREAVVENLRQWPMWVLDTEGAAGTAYAVLTVCCAAILLRSGRWMSKRDAAEEVAAALPHWAPVIDWAQQWWYAEGLHIEPAQRAEVTAFVRVLSSALIDEADNAQQLPDRWAEQARAIDAAHELLLPAAQPAVPSVAGRRARRRAAGVWAAADHAPPEGVDLLTALAARVRGQRTGSHA